MKNRAFQEMEDINDLPIEVLSLILNFLELEDWKKAAQVCRLWRSILHSTRFQRQIMVRINSTFVEPPTDLDKRALSCCRNLSMTQWDESFDLDWYDSSDDDEDENSEENPQKIEVVELKYLYQPTPEHNVAELLFSEELNLESLELCSTFESCRYILEDRLEQLKNLTELTLDIEEGRKSNQISAAPTCWVLRHDRIRKLKLSYIQRQNNFKLATPKLISLDLRSLTVWNMAIIPAYSSQLQQLDLRFENAELVNDLLRLKFPCLTCLFVRMDDDREFHQRYARLRERLADLDLDEQFVKGMPKLKRLSLESHVVFFRMGAAFAKFGHPQLEEIKLDSMHIQAVQLTVLQWLPKLKTFKMQNSEVLPSPENPRVLPQLYLPHLRKLSLIHNESQIVFDKGLVGLTTLTMTIWSSKNHKILYKICNNLPNLENLRLILDTQLVNTSFRYLNRLTKLRFVRIDNLERAVRLWKHCPVVPSVRKVTLTNGILNMATVDTIAWLFPALSELFLEECLFENCDTADDGSSNNAEESDSDSEEEDEIFRLQHAERVRQYFPECRVSLHHIRFSKRR